jgi:hypothetical protein
MPGCSICARRLRTAVNAMLLSGKSERSISVALGIHRSSVHRHRNCLARELELQEKRRERQPYRLRIVYGRFHRESGKFLINAVSSAQEAFAEAAKELLPNFESERDRLIAIRVMETLARKLGFDDDDAEEANGDEMVDAAFPTETEIAAEAGDQTDTESVEREPNSDAGIKTAELSNDLEPERDVDPDPADDSG